MIISLDNAKRVTKNYKDYEILTSYFKEKKFVYEIKADISTIIELRKKGCDPDWLLDLCQAGIDEEV